MSRRETEREIKDTQYRVNTLPIRGLWGLNLSGGPEMKIHRIIEFAWRAEKPMLIWLQWPDCDYKVWLTKLPLFVGHRRMEGDWDFQEKCFLIEGIQWHIRSWFDMARRDITTNGGHVEWRKWWKLVNSGRDRTGQVDETRRSPMNQKMYPQFGENILFWPKKTSLSLLVCEKLLGTIFKTRIKEGINILTLWLSIAVIVLFIPVWCFLCDEARPPTSIVNCGYRTEWVFYIVAWWSVILLRIE